MTNGYKIADGFQGNTKSEILEHCNELDRANRSMGHNLADPSTKDKMRTIITKLETRTNQAVIDRIIQDMADIATPLKQFTDAVLSKEPLETKRMNVEQKGQQLKAFSSRLSKTANVVAFANAKNKRMSETLQHLSSQIQTLTPQLINAGTIRMNYFDNHAAEENFENLTKQYAEGVQSIRDLCDESVDIRSFLLQTEEHIRRSIQVMAIYLYTCHESCLKRPSTGL